MEPRILKIGEKVSGKYKEMQMGQSKKFFKVWIGDEEFYLPKDVGASLLRIHQGGYETFTIHRALDVYEITPFAEPG